jgi:hypothetical protein
MAILPSRPGIKISIVCNGAALQEYNDDEEEPNNNIVSKYIEAISGAEFGIHWKLTPPWPPYTVLLEYRLDQKYVAGTYCKLVHFKRESPRQPTGSTFCISLHSLLLPLVTI